MTEVRPVIWDVPSQSACSGKTAPSWPAPRPPASRSVAGVSTSPTAPQPPTLCEDTARPGASVGSRAAEADSFGPARPDSGSGVCVPRGWGWTRKGVELRVFSRPASAGNLAFPRRRGGPGSQDLPPSPSAFSPHEPSATSQPHERRGTQTHVLSGPDASVQGTSARFPGGEA